jgi:hypothetical protein
VSAEAELLQSVTVVAVVRPLLVRRLRLPEVRDSSLQTLLGVAADLRCRHHHRLLPIARLLLRILRVLRMPLLEEAAERSCRL